MQPPLLLLMLFIASIICVGASPIDEIAENLGRGIDLSVDSAKNMLKKGVAFEKQRAIEEQQKVVSYWEQMERAAKLNGFLVEKQAPPPPPPPGVQQSSSLNAAQYWKLLEDFSEFMVGLEKAKLHKLK